MIEAEFTHINSRKLKEKLSALWENFLLEREKFSLNLLLENEKIKIVFVEEESSHYIHNSIVFLVCDRLRIPFIHKSNFRCLSLEKMSLEKFVIELFSSCLEYSIRYEILNGYRFFDRERLDYLSPDAFMRQVVESLRYFFNRKKILIDFKQSDSSRIQKTLLNKREFETVLKRILFLMSSVIPHGGILSQITTTELNKKKSEKLEDIFELKFSTFNIILNKDIHYVKFVIKDRFSRKNVVNLKIKISSYYDKNNNLIVL